MNKDLRCSFCEQAISAECYLFDKDLETTVIEHHVVTCENCKKPIKLKLRFKKLYAYYEIEGAINE